MEHASVLRRSAALALAALATLATVWLAADYAIPPPHPVTTTASAR